jgi:hypothetical protein
VTVGIHAAVGCDHRSVEHLGHSDIATALFGCGVSGAEDSRQESHRCGGDAGMPIRSIAVGQRLRLASFSERAGCLFAGETDARTNGCRHKSQRKRGADRKCDAVSANERASSIHRASRARSNSISGKIRMKISSKLERSLIAKISMTLRCLRHNPVDLASELSGEAINRDLK